MGQIERGEINLTLTKIYQIADALELTLNELFVVD
jgi:transcriptional regulator with XRE-family HTH domain